MCYGINLAADVSRLTWHNVTSQHLTPTYKEVSCVSRGVQLTHNKLESWKLSFVCRSFSVGSLLDLRLGNGCGRSDQKVHLPFEPSPLDLLPRGEAGGALLAGFALRIHSFRASRRVRQVGRPIRMIYILLWSAISAVTAVR